MKVRAGALAYVVVLSLVIMLMLGLLIINKYYLLSDVNLSMERDAVRDNIKSVQAILEEDDSLIEYEKEFRLLGNSGVSLYVEKENWGLFNIVKITSKARIYSDTSIYMSADSYAFTDTTALYMEDMNNYLSVAGNTIIKGDCSIPALGVRKGYIESTGYYKDTVVYGKMSRSGGDLPVLSEDVNQRFKDLWNFKRSVSLSGDSLCNSFSGDEVVIHSNEPINLSGLSLKGKIKILSDKSVIIDSTTKIENCVVCAPVVNIGNGFEGNLQVFANRYISLGNNVRLKYPSYLYMNSKIKTEMVVGRNSEVYGGVINVGNEESVMKADKESVLYGRVYCDCKAQLQGKIYGSVYVKKLIYYNQWAKYEDVLFHSVIDKTKVWTKTPLVYLFGESKKRVFVEWLD